VQSYVEYAVGLWKRTQGAGERSLASVVERFFADQLRRITATLGDFHRPTAADVATIFDAADERRRMFAMLRPQFGRLASLGAQRQLDLLSARPGSKAADDFEPSFGGQLPDNMQAAIRRFLRELEQQDYWAEIQRTTEHRLADIIDAGLADGDSHRQLAARIREKLGGEMSKTRAMTIARTESTGSLNAGHYAAQQELAAEGLPMKKEWSAVLDDEVRDTHALLNGVAVPVKEDFNLGGWQTPYPGYYQLPAEERINCRCTIISQFDGL
jgi:SPP1 gp7 family putative phage head morphogenesis protein